MSNWETLERPGYLGGRREEKHREWDDRFGQGNWRLAWQIGDRFFGPEAAIALYEDAYFRFLEQNRMILNQLIREASEIYDDDPSNIHSGLDYGVQETGRTHLQDIAIRRCLVRLGQWFRGDTLIQIRDHLGEHPLSMTLSPGQVPFHMSWVIIQPELEGWWNPGSVESFYQSNRYLQVRTPG